jgi:primosomal protein N' (replication factor Y) (superfamily II helicase)
MYSSSASSVRLHSSPAMPLPFSFPSAVAEMPSSYSLDSADALALCPWIEVLVDCPGVQGLYTYSLFGKPSSFSKPSKRSLETDTIPDSILDVQPGDILSVPFGTRQVGAIAIRRLQQLSEQLDPDRIRPIEEIVSPGFFPAGYWALLEQVASYYHTSLMQVIRVALPPGLLGRSQRRIRLLSVEPPAKHLAQKHLAQVTHPAAAQILQLLQAQRQGDYSWQYLQRQVAQAQVGLRELLQRGWVESYLESPAPVRPKQQQVATLVAEVGAEFSSRQQEILDVLKRRGGEMPVQELQQTCQTSSSALKTLARKGGLILQTREVLRLDANAAAVDTLKPLTADQAQALTALNQATGFTTALLHGVTGSGKTEVYLQAIAPVLQRGQSALVLVPEIGLTPQLTDRFRARFGGQVCVYHSGLSEGERYDTWRQLLTNQPQIIIGTRSAVFAPLPNLGIVILDEEHDDSFKQDQPAPCYHARTIAQWRAQLANCPLVLGSATPALETWVKVGPDAPSNLCPSNASSSQSLYLTLPNRIQSHPASPIEVIDMRQELRQGNRSIFSQALQEALQALKTRKQQGILFIHRRGHSTFVSCRSCGHVINCEHCDVSMAYHQPREGGPESLHCHYCGHRQAHPHQCPACGSPYLKHFGSGTQRLIQELNRNLPDLRCIRFDSDTTRAKGAHRTLLNRFAQGEADLLVGTQMLTKGIDLPQVTLVGVVAADGLLHLADYRAGERAYQTLTQVAGRAGRGEHPGRVIVQTYSPQHPVIEAVVRQDYPVFVASELQHRAVLHYPPYGRLVLFRLSGMDTTTVSRTAERLAAVLREHLDRLNLSSSSDYEILGPTAAAIPRVARRYRWQILLKAWSNEVLELPNLELPNLAELRTHCPTTVSLSIDIDPLHLL